MRTPEQRIFAYRVLVLLTAAAIWSLGKIAGFREAQHLFVRGYTFGATSRPSGAPPRPPR